VSEAERRHHRIRNVKGSSIPVGMVEVPFLMCVLNRVLAPLPGVHRDFGNSHSGGVACLYQGRLNHRLISTTRPGRGYGSTLIQKRSNGTVFQSSATTQDRSSRCALWSCKDRLIAGYVPNPRVLAQAGKREVRATSSLAAAVGPAGLPSGCRPGWRSGRTRPTRHSLERSS